MIVSDSPSDPRKHPVTRPESCHTAGVSARLFTATFLSQTDGILMAGMY